MSVIRIYGLRSLSGKIDIQGSKNAVLPVMAASLLHRGITVIKGVPRIEDVCSMIAILENLGCKCDFSGHTLTLDTTDAQSEMISRELAAKMRSSIMLVGPLVGRFHRASTSHPGGCSIGKRPIDLHVSGLQKLGVTVRVEGDIIHASAEKLVGNHITLPFPSVGATENLIMAAVAAEGITTIDGAAKEPEVETLCLFLRQAGAKIQGIGTDRLVIEGGRPLKDTNFSIPGDRIVAGTYVGAVMAAGGEVKLKNAPVQHMAATIDLAKSMGADISIVDDGIIVAMEGRPICRNMETSPYPGFSTDLQSVMMAVACKGRGECVIREEIFERRFSTAKELQKMGAHIIIGEKIAKVSGVRILTGASVTATDLRGGAALVVAGLGAIGYTDVSGYDHISRGYENICRDLQAAGARIILRS